MSEYKYTFRKFIRDWMLILGIIAGASIYLIYHAILAIHPAGPALLGICKTVQPIFLFAMLFLTFCKIEPRQLKPHKWQLWLLIFQCLCFIATALLLIIFPQMHLKIAVEALMLCLIIPTATACAVVTGKLGGDMAGVLTYTILINLAVAVLVPLFVPLIHPVEGLSFLSAFFKILAKVFPLLIMPCLLAWFVRYCLPKLHARLLAYTDLAFYIWAISLTLAILMSTRAIVQSDNSVAILIDIAVASLLSCILQFWAGKKIGSRYGQTITAGQALGQKNTVFGIWMGYTFLDPVVSIAGGLYSIWHNCYNTWQLYKVRKAREAAGL